MCWIATAQWDCGQTSGPPNGMGVDGLGDVRKNTMQIMNFLMCNGVHVGPLLWRDTQDRSHLRSPVLAHHHAVITFSWLLILSTISRGLCKAGPQSSGMNRAALPTNSQAVSRHQLGKKFSRILSKKLKFIRAVTNHSLHKWPKKNNIIVLANLHPCRKIGM